MKIFSNPPDCRYFLFDQKNFPAREKETKRQQKILEKHKANKIKLTLHEGEQFLAFLLILEEIFDEGKKEKL